MPSRAAEFYWEHPPAGCSTASIPRPEVRRILASSRSLDPAVRLSSDTLVLVTPSACPCSARTPARPPPLRTRSARSGRPGRRAELSAAEPSAAPMATGRAAASRRSQFGLISRAPRSDSSARPRPGRRFRRTPEETEDVVPPPGGAAPRRTPAASGVRRRGGGGPACSPGRLEDCDDACAGRSPRGRWTERRTPDTGFASARSSVTNGRRDELRSARSKTRSVPRGRERGSRAEEIRDARGSNRTQKQA
jgi:hypothetical protein